MAKRPNILYIFTDQQSWNALSCAGNPDLATPHMDRLAAEGVRFERAYSPFPLCGPSRASMFFGQYPHELGIEDNGQPVSEEEQGRSLGLLLGAAGYECVYGGKWHIPEITLPDGAHGFRRICEFDDVHLAERCLAFLREPHEKPFFLVASFDNPHNICEFGRQQHLPWGQLPPEPPLEEMPNLPPNYAIPPHEPRAIRLWQEQSPFLRLLRENTPEDWRRYRWGYNRLVEKVDAQIGRILEGLEQTGLAQETVVLFSSDHGDHQGAHRLPQKWTFYEESARVPFLMRAPGQAGGGRTEARLVDASLDLYATVCDYAGAETPTDARGRSLRPLLEGAGDPPWRDHLIGESHFPGIGPLRMVRTERHKYVVHRAGRYRERLHDLAADPGEMVNLALERRHTALLDRHRALLDAWRETTADGFPVYPACS